MPYINCINFLFDFCLPYLKVMTVKKTLSAAIVDDENENSFFNWHKLYCLTRQIWWFSPITRKNPCW